MSTAQCRLQRDIRSWDDGVDYIHSICDTHFIAVQATPVEQPTEYYIIPGPLAGCLSDCSLVRQFMPDTEPLAESSPAKKTKQE